MDHSEQQRRRFLAWASQGMVWLSAGGLAGALTGCGGGGDSDAGGGSTGGNGSGNPGGGTPVSAELRAATLQSVRSAVAGLAAGGASFDSAALVSALQALPALATVGVSNRVGNVWARFTDGQMLVVPNNLVPPVTMASGTAHALRAPARERIAGAGDLDTPAILVAQQYRQLDMLGQVPTDMSTDAAHLCLDWVDANTMPNLRKMAVGRGFTLPEIQTTEPPDFGFDNGIEGLRGLQGDGVFFITAQAAQAGADASPRTVICVDTPANDANLARYDADLKSGLLAHSVHLRGINGTWERFNGFAIGPEFVSLNLWNFPTECIGIFNLSGAPDLSAWVEALTRAHMRHIMTWAQPVSWQRMLAFADDLIQLNLATNNFDGRNVRQNPEPRLCSYGMGESLSYLMKRGIAVGGGSGDALDYLQDGQPSLYVNTLLPTITYATINEDTLQIELVGQFGRPVSGLLDHSPNPAATTDMTPQLVIGTSDAGRFTEPLLSRAADPLLQGNRPLRSPTWEGGLLQTPIDPDDLERGGYLQVINGGRCSNVVPITHWEIPIQAVTTIDDLTLTQTVTIRLRADVHAWRLEPDGFARNGAPQTALVGSVHCRSDFSASGSINQFDASTRTRTTITWSGSGIIRNAIGDFFVRFSGVLNWGNREVMLAHIVVAGGGSYNVQKVTEQFDVNGVLLRRTEENTPAPVTLAAAGLGPSGMLTLGFDNQWNLLAGGFDMLPVPSNILPAPPQRAMNTRLSWQPVRPDFAPRSDFGGT